jgi:predicted O-linked N-acetylglucosamine transferase (SPINDLY family)
MTTTCDALWMGVPTVSLVGQTHASRVGLDLLSQVGLGELAASSADAYVQVAAALAADSDRVRNIRHGLRGRMRASSLTDETTCTARLEGAYRDMWKHWCDSSD